MFLHKPKKDSGGWPIFCCEQRDGWRCTMALGHPGDTHVAISWDSELTQAVWKTGGEMWKRAEARAFNVPHEDRPPPAFARRVDGA